MLYVQRWNDVFQRLRRLHHVLRWAVFELFWLFIMLGLQRWEFFELSWLLIMRNVPGWSILRARCVVLVVVPRGLLLERRLSVVLNVSVWKVLLCRFTELLDVPGWLRVRGRLLAPLNVRGWSLLQRGLRQLQHLPSRDVVLCGVEQLQCMPRNDGVAGVGSDLEFSVRGLRRWVGRGCRCRRVRAEGQSLLSAGVGDAAVEQPLLSAPNFSALVVRRGHELQRTRGRRHAGLRAERE